MAEISKPPCLHCHLKEGVLDYFEARGDRHGDAIVIDIGETLDALALMAAELLAAEPDPVERSVCFSRWQGSVIAKVEELVARGATPSMLRPS